jgi:hypothetical protein
MARVENEKIVDWNGDKTDKNCLEYEVSPLQSAMHWYFLGLYAHTVMGAVYPVWITVLSR